ncbi:tryptophan-rich sensory protein [candidate division KSB1 bacterium]|nr:tryptophan-rich sensory protein [candidate division KSB1 bacterium]
MKSALVMLLFFILVFTAAYTGSRYMPGEWYDNLQKPSWTPPNWLFAPVWTILYIMIAISGWLVWRENGFTGALFPFILFLLQLVLNAMWTWLFFGLHKPAAAFLDITLLWFSILLLIIMFRQISKPAGMLLIPYLIWVAYAATLNYCLWKMNVPS